jgi:gas vesicle protein|uniref:Uncharacterized protein n=1 Tax=Phaeodactylum tricornutum TaxID=2850 RepID=A0A8J9X2U9_PHATR
MMQACIRHSNFMQRRRGIELWTIFVAAKRYRSEDGRKSFAEGMKRRIFSFLKNNESGLSSYRPIGSTNVSESYTKLSKIVSKKSNDLLESSKPMASSLLAKTKEASIRSLQQSKEVAASQLSKTSSSLATKVKQGIDSAAATAKQKSSEASAVAKERTKAILSSTASSFSNGVRSSISNITKPFRRMWTKLVQHMRGTKVLRLLWWWSLAAVGVYGVSTTVPKELIRQGFSYRSKNEDDD